MAIARQFQTQQRVPPPASQAATTRLLSPRTPPTREIENFPIAVRFYDVNGAGITDALIDFCEQANETSSGICELLATSLEK
ncbi:hypothetical protein HPB47_019489, partial [Ixodes persulcatus]